MTAGVGILEVGNRNRRHRNCTFPEYELESALKLVQVLVEWKQGLKDVPLMSYVHRPRHRSSQMQPAFPPLYHAVSVEEDEKLAIEYNDEPSIYVDSTTEKREHK